MKINAYKLMSFKFVREWVPEIGFEKCLEHRYRKLIKLDETSDKSLITHIDIISS